MIPLWLLVPLGDVGCYMTGLRPDEPLARFMGPYERRVEMVNGRPAFVQAANAAALWYASGTWWLGPESILGKKAGVMHLDDGASTPDASSAPWVGWRNDSWAFFPSVRCLSSAAAGKQLAAERTALSDALARSAATVYFVGSQMDKLRREWVGAYKRQRSLGLVNGRHAYAKDGSSTKMMWFAGGAWFVGNSKHRGKPLGVFLARDAASSPERISAPWRAARLVATKPMGGAQLPSQPTTGAARTALLPGSSPRTKLRRTCAPGCASCSFTLRGCCGSSSFTICGCWAAGSCIPECRKGRPRRWPSAALAERPAFASRLLQPPAWASFTLTSSQ